MIRFGLLGPATAWHEGREVDLGSPQQRALFALLVLHRNETVTTDRMVDVLWPVAAPPNAVQVVRTYVSRLRHGPLSTTELITHRHGYELRALPGEVDADRLEALASEAHAELDAGDAPRAEALLEEALALVREPALPELPDDVAATAERNRLDELRAAAAEDLIEARLAQGRHRELLPALRAAVAAAPLRERSWGQLMIALYRSGRQADALAAYHEAQHALDELALAPGPELRALERMVLVQAPALDLPTARLPRQATSFLGREADVAALEATVEAGRLVTLVGPAGVGKTRLAAEVAARAGVRVWWVDLVAAGAGRVAATAARALNVPHVPGRTPADLVVARLREAPALLVLDNCEHLLEESARFAAHVQQDGVPVRMLATSREALRIDGERVHRLDGLADGPATRLLLDRAGSAEHDPAAISEVVGRLDGLPLAIELAAGKLRTITAADLARGLRERLSLLAGGDRTMPARQRTLEAAIAWSYELLPATEQRVLRRLSVFVGGFDAATAESVAAGDGVEPAAVLPALARVVDASLLVAEQDRYRLLLTVRAFARERLQEAREAHATAERHRDAYLAFAEALSRNMTSAGLAGWLPRGRCEHENLQAALAWSLEQHDGTPTVRLAGCLSLFWFRIGFAKDGRELLERALARAAPTGRALVGRCALAHLAGATGTADLGDAAVALCEAERDDELLSLALCWRAHERIATGRLAHAREDSLRAHAVAARAGSEEGLGFSDQLLGDVLERQGDLVGAHAALARSVARYRKLRAPLDAGYALVDFARVTLACGDADEAVTLAGAAVEDFRHREDPRGRAAACAVLGRAYQRVGEPDRARAVFDETAALSRRWGFVLPDSRQLDEAPEEATGGPRVEALPDERAAAVVRGRREQRHGDPRLAEELR